MSQALTKIEHDVKVALKARESARVLTLRGLVSRIKLAAKNDKDRAPRDDDVITAIQKSIKELNETRDIYVSRSVSTAEQDAELAILAEYLPTQMSAEVLEQTIREIIQDQPTDGPSGKALMGPVMKILRERYSGEFDPKAASTIASRLIA